MDKKQQNNKIGESFEQQLPDEFVPDFIWDNISNSLENSSTPIESTEKVKASFEEGFDHEVLPVFLWEGIENSLDQTSIPAPSLDANNKIKTSFETGHQDLVPEDLWKNVENQLEIEGVWKRVLKGLNKRTRRHYWQEKGMQFGILALALLLLRGCEFGEWYPTLPLANQSNSTPKAELVADQHTTATPFHANAASTKQTTGTEQLVTTNYPSKNNSTEQTNTTTPNKNSAASKAPNNANKVNLETNSFASTNTSILTAAPSGQDNPSNKEGHSTNLAETMLPIQQQKTTKNNTTAILPNNNLANSSLGQQNNTSTKPKSTTNFTNPNEIVNPLSTSKIAALSNNQNNFNADNNLNNTASEAAPKTLLSQVPLSTLTGQPFIDPTIDQLYAFQINNVLNKKRHTIRFELGMNGKVGSSLLLGNATNKAMETTSMAKTKMRVAGSVGLLLDCYLTANDAIVFGAYPLSSSQQYFGGYTNEGRYYHKEVKLAYFDFTVGYQRTLFHYNDFGTVPSSMYARLDYGLGYLSKSEEIVNGLATELGDCYNKLNHNIGLTIGNTHRINRFVVDYGIYGNIGVSSVLSASPSGANQMEYSNLATMGGYIGLRYVL